MNESSRSVFAARGMSIRALLVGSLFIIMILLLLIAVLSYVFSFRLSQALEAMDEEIARADMALKVDKAAADVFAALARGTLIRDPVYFVQSVEEASQALIDAEERLVESANSLSRDDPLRLHLYELESGAKGVRRLVGLMSRRAKDEQWEQVEQFELTMIPSYRDLVIAATERVRAATAERRAAAAVEVEGIRRIIQIVPMAVGLLILVIVSGTIFVIVRVAARPIERLTDAAMRLAAGHLEERAHIERIAEFGRLASAFNEMADQLELSHAQLEQRVAERTRDLERSLSHQKASAEVSSAATSILETDRLMRKIVELIRERFDLYYVGLFLVDEAGEWAVLRDGSGEAGQAMLARGHRIKIGEGMIGWSIANDRPRIASRAETDVVRLLTSELPGTRSEAALPLRSRGQVLGALSVQDDQFDAFDEDTLTVLQTMADQVAVALDNARLLAESQKALAAERRAYGESSGRAWDDMLSARVDWGYLYAGHVVAPSAGDWQPEMVQSARIGQMVQGIEPAKGEDGAGEATLAIPLKARDKVIGVLRFQKEELGWVTEEVTLLETLTEQVGLAIESAQLYQDTQRRAARERLMGEVTARLRESLDVKVVAQLAAQELGQVLGADSVTIHLGSAERLLALPGEKDQV